MRFDPATSRNWSEMAFQRKAVTPYKYSGLPCGVAKGKLRLDGAL